MIALEQLTCRFGDITAVESLSLTVEDQELLVLVGGSGSGKTTTLKMINRLIEPTSGRVLLDGADVQSVPDHELRRRIGYCFQKVGLFPHMTIAENIGITPKLLGWPRQRIDARTDALLKLFDLAPHDYRDRMPSELSGGQQQRIGVARALAAEPSVILLDEPFGALDPVIRYRMQEEFQRIRRDLKLTVVFVTHDMAEALLLGDRVAVLDNGHLVQVGTSKELISEPATDFVDTDGVDPLPPGRCASRHAAFDRTPVTPTATTRERTPLSSH